MPISAAAVAQSGSGLRLRRLPNELCWEAAQWVRVPVDPQQQHLSWRHWQLPNSAWPLLFVGAAFGVYLRRHLLKQLKHRRQMGDQQPKRCPFCPTICAGRGAFIAHVSANHTADELCNELYNNAAAAPPPENTAPSGAAAVAEADSNTGGGGSLAPPAVPPPATNTAPRSGLTTGGSSSPSTEQSASTPSPTPGPSGAQESQLVKNLCEKFDNMALEQLRATVQPQQLILCRKCWQLGHETELCPQCEKCGQWGHESPNCPNSSAEDLR